MYGSTFNLHTVTSSLHLMHVTLSGLSSQNRRVWTLHMSQNENRARHLELVEWRFG